ncbi:hypothetical protein Cadr_000024444 [Camelus dromedarius]|uniref:Uncharacterized protein n=1 Tax=Camelus dromedarius TaxID=9838 RepID=A0A5N4CNS9_CAMDR|nr:hypothetical protein Cadr_000024444 [Camelus dromedarius]
MMLSTCRPCTLANSSGQTCRRPDCSSHRIKHLQPSSPILLHQSIPLYKWEASSCNIWSYPIPNCHTEFHPWTPGGRESTRPCLGGGHCEHSMFWGLVSWRPWAGPAPSGSGLLPGRRVPSFSYPVQLGCVL